MRSPLGPALANIFVGYHVEKLSSVIRKPSLHFRYVDDTFAIFDHAAELYEFLVTLNCLYPSLNFTFKKDLLERFICTMQLKRKQILLQQLQEQNSSL